jgi:hypothetical protein
LLWVTLGVLVIAVSTKPLHTTEAQSGEPPDDEQCLVSVEGVGIDVRSGPSTACPIVLWLTDVPLPVIGQATSGGEGWWQLELTGLDQAWVPQEKVTILTEEACERVEVVPAPTCRIRSRYVWRPQLPAGPASPSSGWGTCGSCSTCGYDPYECVLSPAGTCLWDPATCKNSGPPDEGEGWGACGSCSTCGYDPYECVLSPEGACLWDPGTCHLEEEEACIPEPEFLTCPEGLIETFMCPGDARCPAEVGGVTSVTCHRMPCFDSCGNVVDGQSWCDSVPS